MSKDLPLSKLRALAESLSGKECAFLAIEYVNNEKKDGKNYDDEVKLIQSTISPFRELADRQEFAFHWNLWRDLSFFALDLQTCILMLRASHRQLGIAKSIFVTSCLIRHIHLTFRWIPKIYTPEQFEEVYKKVREKHLSETMPLMQVARYETFRKLQQKGYLDEGDEAEGVINWYEEDNNKTLEELIREKAESIKDYLDNEELRKKRGAIAVGGDIYTEYVGLTLTEIEEKVKQTDTITKPPEEEVKRWKEELTLMEAKLGALIKKGKLAPITVNDSFGWYHNGEEFTGMEGITAQSWYDFSEKLDKNFNKYIDDKNQLVEFSEGEFLVANGGMAGYVKEGETNCSAERTRLRVIEEIDKYQSVKQDDDGYLDITSEDLKSAFISRIGEAQGTIKRVKEHIEVIKRAKDQIFDDVVDISDDLIKEGEGLIQEVVADQQETLDFIVQDFSLLAFFKDVKWKDEEKYKLNPDIEIDEKWVEESINDLIGYANKESGSSYRRNAVLQSSKK